MTGIKKWGKVTVFNAYRKFMIMPKGGKIGHFGAPNQHFSIFL